MTLHPIEDRVVILQDDAKTETTGGLHIPEQAQEKPNRGTIVKVGPGKADDRKKPIGYLVNHEFHHSLDVLEININDRVEPVYAKPFIEGDQVLYAYYAGHAFTFEDKEYIIMRWSDIIATV